MALEPVALEHLDEGVAGDLIELPPGMTPKLRDREFRPGHGPVAGSAETAGPSPASSI